MQQPHQKYFIPINPQAFVPLLYFLKSAKQANLVSEKYQCCRKVSPVRTDRPGQRILLFAEKLPCYPAVLRATNAGKQNVLLTPQSFFEFLSCFFPLQISIQFSAVVSSSLSFLSTNLHHISNAKSFMFSNFCIFIWNHYLCWPVRLEYEFHVVHSTGILEVRIAYTPYVDISSHILFSFNISISRFMDLWCSRYEKGNRERRYWYDLPANFLCFGGTVCSSVCTLVQNDNRILKWAVNSRTFR